MLTYVEVELSFMDTVEHWILRKATGIWTAFAQK